MTPSRAFIDSLLSLAWGQWTLLGVRGVVHASSPAVAVGLEELLLLTARLAEHDPRLRDEALDWSIENGQFISKPRLKGLLRIAEPTVKACFSPWSHILAAELGGNWPGAGATAAWRFSRSRKSKAPDLDRPELVALKARALFGVGARADVISAAVAWPAPDFTASDLTHVGYNKRSLAVALDWLRSGALLDRRVAGNQVRYSWRKRAQVIQLLDPLPDRFPRWPTLIRVISVLLHLFEVNERKSARLAAVETAKTLSELSSDLRVLDLDPRGMHPRAGLQ